MKDEDRKTRIVVLGAMPGLGYAGGILNNCEIVESVKLEREPFERPYYPLIMQKQMSRDIRDPRKNFKSVNISHQRIKRGRR